MTRTIWTRLALGIALLATPAVLTGCSEPAPTTVDTNPVAGSPPPATPPTVTPGSSDTATKPADGKSGDSATTPAPTPAGDSAEKKVSLKTA